MPRIHASAALAAVAGLASAATAQESVVFTYTFIETAAGTTTPVTSPNGVIEPGESARIFVTVRVTPDIGATVTYHLPPPGGTGTIAGLGVVFYDLIGRRETHGTFNHLSAAAGWNLSANGTPNGEGTGLIAIIQGQSPLPGTTATSTNPINNIWRGVWTPLSYSPRFVNFIAADSIASPGQACSILVQHGLDPEGNPRYLPKYVLCDFGGGVYIPVAPAPAGLLLLASGALAASRRRRR